VIARLEDADYEGPSLTMLQRTGAALNQKIEIYLATSRGKGSARLTLLYQVAQQGSSIEARLQNLHVVCHLFPYQFTQIRTKAQSISPMPACGMRRRLSPWRPVGRYTLQGKEDIPGMQATSLIRASHKGPGWNSLSSGS
jgi:hypothetical protein